MSFLKTQCPNNGNSRGVIFPKAAYKGAQVAQWVR